MVFSDFAQTFRQFLRILTVKQEMFGFFANDEPGAKGQELVNFL